MRFDCRKENRDPTARLFPCAVKIIDPQTGERIANVFFLDTTPLGSPSLGRFVTGLDGETLVSPERKKRRVDNGRGGWKLEVYYERLEVWERRSWVAVAVDTGEVIAKSEDAP
jgi:hypothetical protein